MKAWTQQSATASVSMYAGDAHELLSKLEALLLEPAGRAAGRIPTVTFSIKTSSSSDETLGAELTVDIESKQIFKQWLSL